MGLTCNSRVNLEEPKPLLLGEFCRSHLKQHRPGIVDDEIVENVDGVGLVEVHNMREGVPQKSLGWKGVATRPRVKSEDIDLFKALFTKNSRWVGKLMFGTEEGIIAHIPLEYRVLGFTRAGDVEAERIVWEQRGRATLIPAKMYFDVFFEGEEAEPVMIFKCEDSELVLVVDTRIKNVHLNLDVKNQFIEGIGYRNEKVVLTDSDLSDMSEPSESLPSLSGENWSAKSDDLYVETTKITKARLRRRMNMGEFFLCRSKKPELLSTGCNINNSAVRHHQEEGHKKIEEETKSIEELWDAPAGTKGGPENADRKIRTPKTTDGTNSPQSIRELLCIRGSSLDSDVEIPMPTTSGGGSLEMKCSQWLEDDRGPGYPQNIATHKML